jgi:hypothetical protein
MTEKLAELFDENAAPPTPVHRPPPRAPMKPAPRKDGRIQIA